MFIFCENHCYHIKGLNGPSDNAQDVSIESGFYSQCKYTISFDSQSSLLFQIADMSSLLCDSFIGIAKLRPGII